MQAVPVERGDEQCHDIEQTARDHIAGQQQIVNRQC